MTFPHARSSADRSHPAAAGKRHDGAIPLCWGTPSVTSGDSSLKEGAKETPALRLQWLPLWGSCQHPLMLTDEVESVQPFACARRPHPTRFAGHLPQRGRLLGFVLIFTFVPKRLPLWGSCQHPLMLTDEVESVQPFACAKRPHPTRFAGHLPQRGRLLGGARSQVNSTAPPGRLRGPAEPYQIPVPSSLLRFSQMKPRTASISRLAPAM